MPYAGYLLPVQFSSGLKHEHLHTRSKASLFDVSHMGQVLIRGKERDAFIERVFSGDLTGLDTNTGALSLILHHRGGILDDSIVSKHEGEYHIVVNGACKEKDLNHFQAVSSTEFTDVDIELLDQHSLVAIQGPSAAELLQRHTHSPLTDMPFMSAQEVRMGTVDNVRIMRCGYTGEDGFELSCRDDQMEGLVSYLLAEEPDLHPAGLGARDSLRLEAGLCLYGNDMDDTLDPLSCGLKWTLAKHNTRYIGCEAIEKLIQEGVPKKRVGLTLSKGIARAGVPLYVGEGGVQVGEVQSGGYSPCLDVGIAMASVDRTAGKVGDVLLAKVRNKYVEATITRLPFVPHQYYRG